MTIKLYIHYHTSWGQRLVVFLDEQDKQLDMQTEGEGRWCIEIKPLAKQKEVKIYLRSCSSRWKHKQRARHTKNREPKSGLR